MGARGLACKVDQRQEAPHLATKRSVTREQAHIAGQPRRCVFDTNPPLRGERRLAKATCVRACACVAFMRACVHVCVGVSWWREILLPRIARPQKRDCISGAAYETFRCCAGVWPEGLKH